MKIRIKKILTILGLIIAGFLLFGIYEIYIPKSFTSKEATLYAAQQGMGDEDIAAELKAQGIIKSNIFFELYVVLSGQHAKLQAGLYDVSPSMSIAAIVHKLVSGDVVKHKITIIEGWDVKDIATYMDKKGFYKSEEFIAAAKKDYSKEFDFLKSKPKNIGLEGYIFPDTYRVPAGVSAEDFIRMTLNNFGRKLTPELRQKIAADKHSIFQVVTMASILEKEVVSLQDKKTVAGILWKRLAAGMPLQVDSTVNYVTGKSDASATLADIKIDSLYNTYKYAGLPLGPISSPGAESLIAAAHPTKSEYWYYLSASGSGKTIFSRTFQEHKAAMSKYLLTGI